MRTFRQFRQGSESRLQLHAHRVFLQWHTLAIAGLVLWCTALSIVVATW